MDEFSPPPLRSPPRPAEPSVTSRLPWLAGLFLLLLAVLLAPSVVERVQYAITHGRERAQVDVARAGLPDPTLAYVSHQFAVVAKAIGPSVVHVTSEQIINGNGREMSDFLSARQYQYRAQGLGSGVIVDEAGFVLTNYHVVENARSVQVKLNDSETRSAEIVGLDGATDLAVLKIAPGGLVAAQWGDSDALEVGSLVWAVGNPYGLDRSVSAGIVSAKSRRGLGGSPYQDYLQTDAAVNPGNSGGPLVDVTGRIVGINTAIVGRTYQGISFSIPGNAARAVYEQLQSEGKIERGYLGVRLADVTPDLARSLKLKTLQGAVVEEVVDDTPAAKAGIEPGDVIIQWNGQAVTDATELILLVGKTKIGSPAKVALLRDAKPLEIEVTIEGPPARRTR
jgi:serine protease Do